MRGDRLESRVWFKPLVCLVIRILKRLKEIVFLPERVFMYRQIGARSVTNDGSNLKVSI